MNGAQGNGEGQGDNLTPEQRAAIENLRAVFPAGFVFAAVDGTLTMMLAEDYYESLVMGNLLHFYGVRLAQAAVKRQQDKKKLVVPQMRLSPGFDPKRPR
jgi:hypothetical protein